ncbi:radical SAM protein, partial [bacterium]|nr:radical SAM protein [bacterium]
MDFGLYFHIPYCVQRCHYCDFTTFEQDKILPQKQYVDSIISELSLRSHWAPKKNLTSIYFGGGTPSLLKLGLLEKIFDALNKQGFTYDQGCEVTLEINPATISKDSLKTYMDLGVNRFSVGAQSFNDKYLKACGRIHSA